MLKSFIPVATKKTQKIPANNSGAVIFYGLGNNSKQYLHTKHNAGRLVLENLAESFGLKFEKKQKYSFACETIEFEGNSRKLYFLYSTGFMNESGQPLEQFIKYFKLNAVSKNIENSLPVIILHDDSDQIVGKQKLLPAGGHGGHNGIKSIQQHLGSLGLSQDVWRLKIGIRPENNKLKSENFVLGEINNFEKEYYKQLAKKFKNSLDLIFKNKFSDLQTEINSFKVIPTPPK